MPVGWKVSGNCSLNQPGFTPRYLISLTVAVYFCRVCLQQVLNSKLPRADCAWHYGTYSRIKLPAIIRKPGIIKTHMECGVSAPCCVILLRSSKVTFLSATNTLGLQRRSCHTIGTTLNVNPMSGTATIHAMGWVLFESSAKKRLLSLLLCHDFLVES